MFLKGQGVALPEHPAADWARQLDQPDGGARPVRPPEPRPPAALRPRKLSVTEIETWLRDPYAIHARRVLKLRPLDPLDQETDAAEYGVLVHAGLHRFLGEHGTHWPPAAAARLREALAFALAQTAPREALRAWWTPRLDRIADWVAEVEASRRAVAAPEVIVSEAQGLWTLARPGGAFELIGRADRIELRAGLGLAILDYKTGTPPNQAEVDAGLAPQLLLEAAMAQAGAFGAELVGPAAELIYWHLSGGFDPGASLAVQGQRRGDRGRGGSGGGVIGGADRYLRRPGAGLSVAPASRPRAALRRLRATRASGGMVGGRRGRVIAAVTILTNITIPPLWGCGDTAAAAPRAGNHKNGVRRREPAEADDDSGGRRWRPWHG